MSPPEKLRAWRKKRAPAGKKMLSQSDAARLVGVTAPTWCDWENERKIPDIESVLEVEKVVGIRVREWAELARAKSSARKAAALAKTG